MMWKTNQELLGGGICHDFVLMDYRLLHPWLWKVTVTPQLTSMHRVLLKHHLFQVTLPICIILLSQQCPP